MIGVGQRSKSHNIAKYGREQFASLEMKVKPFHFSFSTTQSHLNRLVDLVDSGPLKKRDRFSLKTFDEIAIASRVT
jgi:hypothetical protein